MIMFLIKYHKKRSLGLTTMKNREIAKIFNEIAEYLEMDGIRFKPYAYQKAAITLENLKDSVEDVYNQGGLKAFKSIPGVGESIALKIEEYLNTGKIQVYGVRPKAAH